jgi:hypothetical protein
MRNTLIVLALVASGYLLATLHTPARADDSGKVVDALRELVRAEEKQADALRRIAESSAKCAR